jgi:glycosidase
MSRYIPLVLVCARLAGAAAPAVTPAVTKVEPPDWPAAAKATTLRMLVTGTSLAGATVSSPWATDRVKASASGTHLFFDLTIPAGARPGAYPIEIRTSGGEARAAFAIVPALAGAGRFQGFSPDDVIYQIMPDRFANGDPSNDDPPVSHGLFDRAKSRYYHGGDFEGIIQHLAYLKELGATALWLTPICDNANRLNERETYSGSAITDYHGYGAVDYYAVDEHFGTLEKFRELVDKAHALGIRIIQDQVANHVGPYHPWAADPPTPTWFNGTEARHLANDWRTWTLIDPHATPEMRKSTLDGWFINILPDLNQGDPETARYLIQNTLWWIGRTGIDGIRQDTLPYVPRTFWREWTAAIKQSYPAFRVVGEVFDSDPGLVSFFQGGKARFDGVDSGIDALFDFPLQAAVSRVFTGEAPARDLAQVLAHDWLYVDAGRLVTFAGLHDQPRFMHAKGATYDGLRQALSFVLTARGTPMIYYGDEIGMPGGGDPDNRRDFPGGWKEDPRNAFEPAGRTPDEQKLFTQLQRLMRLRGSSDALRHGRMVDLLAADQAYAFARVTPRARAVVVFNNAPEAVTLHIPLAGSGVADGATLADGYGSAPAAQVREGAMDVRLEPRAVAIYQ